MSEKEELEKKEEKDGEKEAEGLEPFNPVAGEEGEKIGSINAHVIAVIAGVIFWFFGMYLSIYVTSFFNIEYDHVYPLFFLISPIIAGIVDFYLIKEVTRGTAISVVMTFFFILLLAFFIAISGLAVVFR